MIHVKVNPRRACLTGENQLVAFFAFDFFQKRIIVSLTLAGFLPTGLYLNTSNRIMMFLLNEKRTVKLPSNSYCLKAWLYFITF